MQFIHLVLHHFFRVEHFELWFGPKGIIYVQGLNKDVGQSNESGKSTIFMALCWCLYGKFPGAIGKIGDEIVNPLFKFDCYVKLEGKINGLDFSNMRTRMEGPKGKGGAHLYLDLDNSRKTFDLGKKDISDSNEAIVDLLGCDYETFIRQHYLSYSNLQPVTRMKDAALKQFFLESILNIEWTQNALERAKNEAKRIDACISEREYKKANADRLAEVHRTRLDDYEAKDKEWAKEEKERKVKIKEELDELLLLIKKAKKSNIQVEKKIKKQESDNSTKIKTLENKLKLLAVPQDYDEEVNKWEKEYRLISVEADRNKQKQARAQDKMVDYRTRIDDVAKEVGANCEHCGTVITEDHLEYMVQEYREAIKDWTTQFSDLIDEGAGILKRMAEVEKNLAVAKEKRESQKGKLEDRANLRVKIEQTKREVDKELEALKDELIDLSDSDNEVSKLNKQLEEVKQSPMTSLIKSELEELANVVEEGNRAVEEIEAYKGEQDIVAFWVKGFSSSGIQSYLLDNVTPIINRNIARYMADLADSRITIRLHTVKKLKTGEYRENFHTEIRNIDGGDTFVSLSDGAKSRADLAVSLAVADFQRSLSPHPLQLLILDEVTAALDSFWEERFLKLIRKNFSDSHCFFVSHKQNLSPAYFDRTMVVIKQNGITQLLEEQ